MEPMEHSGSAQKAEIKYEPICAMRFLNDDDVRGVGRTTTLCVISADNYNGFSALSVSLVEKRAVNAHVNNIQPREQQEILRRRGISTRLCVIKVDNYSGLFQLSVSLMEKRSDNAHVNRLYLPEQNQWTFSEDGAVAMKQFQGSGNHQIPKLGVIRAEFDEADPRTRTENTSAVRFQFKIDWLNNSNDPPTVLISEPVIDLGIRPRGLALLHVNPDRARCNMQPEVTVLCYGMKNAVKVYFETEHRRWREEARCAVRHENAAMVVIVPKYPFLEGGVVDVILRCENDFSNRVPFTYLPETVPMPTKRRQLFNFRESSDGTNYNDFKKPRMGSADSSLQADSVVDLKDSEASSNLKEILFDVAAGNINFDKCLSDKLIGSKQMLEEDDDGYTALATAIVMGQFKVVRHFLEQLPKQRSAKGLIPLVFSELRLSHLLLFPYCCVDNVPVDLFRLAVQAGFSPDKCDAEGNSLLHLLICRNRLCDLLQVLQDAQLQEAFRPHLERLNDDGRTALHLAVLGRHTQAVEALLEAGTNPNTLCRNSRLSPLHLAVLSAASQEMVLMLVEKGANVNCSSLDGKSPLDLAVQEENAEMQQLLKKHGAEEEEKEEEENEKKEEEEEEEELEEDEAKSEETRGGKEVQEAAPAKPQLSTSIDPKVVEATVKALEPSVLEQLREVLIHVIKPNQKSLLQKSSSLSADLVLRVCKDRGMLAEALAKIGK